MSDTTAPHKSDGLYRFHDQRFSHENGGVKIKQDEQKASEKERQALKRTAGPKHILFKPWLEIQKNQLQHIHYEDENGACLGRWTQEEHERFLAALKLYGKNWFKVQEHVGTRKAEQVRSHAQKFFKLMKKTGTTVEIFEPALSHSEQSRTESSV